jgi:flagellin-like protein
MFRNISKDGPRGQVGIGTLIIFIAMVLVAAVAAGVLVNTSGLLQSQAEDTGADAQAQISNQIEVVTATGVVDTDNDNIETVELVVKKSAGSDPIDLSQASIQYTSDSASRTLTYVDGTTTSATEFTTESEKDVGSTTDPDQVLDSNGDRVKISVSAQAIEGDTDPDGIAEGEEAMLRIVDQSGATTVYGVNVPDTLGSQDFVEV